MYKWIVVNKLVRRLADGASIPLDTANVDWQAFQKWIADGNTPQAADPSPTDHSARKQALVAAIASNGLIERLRNATPGQIDTFIDNRASTLQTQINGVTNITQARAAMSAIVAEQAALAKALAKAVAYLLRGHED